MSEINNTDLLIALFVGFGYGWTIREFLLKWKESKEETRSAGEERKNG